MNTMSVSQILNIDTSRDPSVVAHGWIKSIRKHRSGLSFLDVHDGSCFRSVQVVVSGAVWNRTVDRRRFTTGSSVEIVGRVRKSIGRKQEIEISAETVRLLGGVSNPQTYPMSSKPHRMEHLRSLPHLSPRTHTIGSIARIRHTLAQSIHEFLDKKGFFWINTPIITSLDAEGSSKTFQVSTLDLDKLPRNERNRADYAKDFFKKRVFLTVSGQLTEEPYACALSKVYAFGPVFRAEQSDTNRHLAEFWMVEPEMAFSTLTDCIDLAESMLKHVFESILTKRHDDVLFLSERNKTNIVSRLERDIRNGFIRIEYAEAISILEKHQKKFRTPIHWGMDFSFEHEAYLCGEYFRSLTVVKNYPRRIKPFYMRINPDQTTVSAMDVLAPTVGEIAGGSQREERLNELDEQIDSMDLSKKDYWWYRELRKYGTVPHSGFGLGIERLILYVTKAKNIRDVVPFHRSLHHARF